MHSFLFGVYYMKQLMVRQSYVEKKMFTKIENIAL